MKKLGGNRGEISVLELILIPLIIFFVVFFLIQGGRLDEDPGGSWQ
ncbi:MAG: hypothetical protein LKK26_03385 [Solobacterium sp.]|jgi:hypothetical protein|nr:hypothetical protein [Solobacterium sp.]